MTMTAGATRLDSGYPYAADPHKIVHNRASDGAEFVTGRMLVPDGGGPAPFPLPRPEEETA